MIISVISTRNARFFLGTTYQNGKIYQMAIKYTLNLKFKASKIYHNGKIYQKYTNILKFKDLKNLRTCGVLVCKFTIWQH
jgi:hypothetical protein